MSRTYRRKNRIPEWVVTEWKKIDGIWTDVPYIDNELKTVISKYKSDSGECCDGNDVPKRFRQTLNRIFRAKMNAETQRILKQADYYEYEYTPFGQTAAWEYW